MKPHVADDQLRPRLEASLVAKAQVPIFLCPLLRFRTLAPTAPPLLASAEGCAVLPCAPETKYLKNTCVQKLIVDFIAMNRLFRVVGGQLYLTWTLPLHAVSLRMLLSFLFKNFFSCMSKSYFFC